MLKENKIKIAVALLLIGVGLCIAGLAFVPLFAIGGVIITAALAMIPQILLSKTPPNTPVESEAQAEVVTAVPPKENIVYNLNLFLSFRANSKRFDEVKNSPKSRLTLV